MEAAPARPVEAAHLATLALLTFAYCIGEVAHFLPTVTSKALANSIRFGDSKCYSTNSSAGGRPLCAGFETETDCRTQEGCRWLYSGQGWHYQVLAGPAFIVTFTISGVVMGFLADRVSRPRLLAGCTALLATCTILTGLSTAYWQLLLLRMGIALGEGALRPAGTALIAEMFQAEHRAVANGLFSWGVYFGYGLSFIFGIYLTELDLFGQGWRTTYVLAGLPGLVVAVPLGLMVDPREGGREASGAKEKEALRKMSQTHVVSGTRYLVDVVRALWQPGVVMLFLAASVRHTAGYAWAHNNVPYFSHYHEGKEIGYWLTICTIAGGSVGVVGGGYLSDRVVARLGLHSRLWLLALCTLLATPFALLTLFLEPPLAFATLSAYYFFAETWFSLLFTVLVEMVPANTRSGCIGTFLFFLNNVGGNLPMVVEPLTQARGLGLHSTLYIMWPGLVALSALLFLLASLPVWAAGRERAGGGGKAARKLSLD